MGITRLSGVLVAATLACGSGETKSAPALIQNPVTEAQLTTITLSPEAVTRLGIQTVAAETTTVAATRDVGGEVVAPPGQALTITAPVAATVLAPEGKGIPAAGSTVGRLQAIMRLIPLPSDKDQLSAESRLRQAEAEAGRIGSLYADRLVSAREHEQAQADLAAARATYRAARAPSTPVEDGATAGMDGLVPLVITAPESGVIRALNVAAGQAVAAGAPLAEIVRMDRLWIRVPLYSGQVRDVAKGEDASVRSLDASAGSLTFPARPVVGPPTANPEAASVDLFYETRAAGRVLRPGERVSVSIPLIGSNEKALVVPLGAVLYDMHGGTWVYHRTDSLTFVRTRVEITRVVGLRVVLSRGIAPGAQVVTAGAVELFGTEFGVGK